MTSQKVKQKEILNQKCDNYNAAQRRWYFW